MEMGNNHGLFSFANLQSIVADDFVNMSYFTANLGLSASPVHVVYINSPWAQLYVIHHKLFKPIQHMLTR